MSIQPLGVALSSDGRGASRWVWYVLHISGTTDGHTQAVGVGPLSTRENSPTFDSCPGEVAEHPPLTAPPQPCASWELKTCTTPISGISFEAPDAHSALETFVHVWSLVIAHPPAA